MQKLSGISSGKNNKSCGIFHNESKKFGFAFFRFFCNFLCNLQEIAKALLLLELPIAGRPSKRNLSLQCGPWDGLPARGDQNPAAPVREMAGKGCGEEGELT
jgi:hypothetical protein